MRGACSASCFERSSGSDNFQVGPYTMKDITKHNSPPPKAEIVVISSCFFRMYETWSLIPPFCEGPENNPRLCCHHSVDYVDTSAVRIGPLSAEQCLR